MKKLRITHVICIIFLAVISVLLGFLVYFMTIVPPDKSKQSVELIVKILGSILEFGFTIVPGIIGFGSLVIFLVFDNLYKNR